VQADRAQAHQHLTAAEASLADQGQMLTLKDDALVRAQAACMKLEDEMRLVLSSRCDSEQRLHVSRLDSEAAYPQQNATYVGTKETSAQSVE
jgi:hypothetical protein